MTHKEEYYVYVYCDPRKKGEYKYNGIDFIFNFEPFYVGMGKGYRYKRHVTKFEVEWNYNTIKNGKIKHIIKEGFDPLKYVLFIQEKIFRENALLLEKELIKKIGRISNNSGCLANLTDGGGWFKWNSVTI